MKAGCLMKEKYSHTRRRLARLCYTSDSVGVAVVCLRSRYAQAIWGKVSVVLTALPPRSVGTVWR